MIRSLLRFLLCGSLLSIAACSKRDQSNTNAKEQSDFQAATNGSDDGGVANHVATSNALGTATADDDEEFSEFSQRLKQMKLSQRQPGQTLLTGKTLVFDYNKRFVKLDQQVRVTDDHGELTSDSLIGHFSVSNQVESVEAKGDVRIKSEDRTSRSDGAVYNYQTGLVQLEGQASVAEGGNQLSGERIRFWIKGDRKMVCEPNAVLVVSNAGKAGFQGVPSVEGNTEIRANKVVYDEDSRRVDLLGNVRLRDPRAAMNCDEVHLFLKDDNKIDWIEASSNVIIQTEDRKALADRATFNADEKKFTLEGSPMVKQGPNVMTGDQITLWLKPQHMVCEPHARLLLYLDEKTRAKFLKDLND